ncbi:MAG: GDP-fucose synthetase [Acidiphilium sp. 37-64-53]|nr:MULTISPECIES: GDP-L-fucose synthase [unclassified Acidiphilium]OYW00166.1 MAG: GDP-fucose synthetase [Acidiphilium sp. 37-64-53]OZB25970.1 MAG: GDP-fucose synthetase [Acidiphilium sp. 34-64-41]
MDRASRIYVAGHQGLIGSAVLRLLATQGHENIVTAKRTDLDLTYADNVHKFFQIVRPDYVILAAGKVGGIIANSQYPADFITANLAIQLNVLQAAYKVGVAKLILFGSSCMYPRHCSQPMAETALHTGLPETTSMAYAVANMAAIEMCLAYNRQYGNQTFVPIIPSNVYGPNDNFNLESGHVVPALLRRLHEARVSGAPHITLWGSGQPRREFIYADDVAAAAYNLLNTSCHSLELPINVGYGRDLSIKDLANLAAEVTAYKGQILWDESKPDGSPRKLLDSRRLLDRGWSPKVELEDGLQRTYAWYVQQRETVS